MSPAQVKKMLKPTSYHLRKMGITSPSVVIDQARAQANIQRMARKAAAAHAVFRPHFKTHQSALIARWFQQEGVQRITVSSLTMAEFFADLGWQDITLALLFNPLEIKRASHLAQRLEDRGGRLGFTVESPEVVDLIAKNTGCRTNIWLKIDTGYGRTGIKWNDAAGLGRTLDKCHELAVPVGLLTHSGHSYTALSPFEVKDIYAETVVRMRAARVHTGNTNLKISLGDTPTCSLVDDLSACDEIRPGNFVFNDLMQLEIGSCGEKDLASATACPVLGVYPERQQVVIHGGAVHLSKEHLTDKNGRPVYGCLGTVSSTGLDEVLPQAPLTSLSQEHGVIDFKNDFEKLAKNLVPGDLVLVWPVHSCLTCDQLKDQMAAPITI